jgi:hypothetical protein
MRANGLAQDRRRIGDINGCRKGGIAAKKANFRFCTDIICCYRAKMPAPGSSGGPRPDQWLRSRYIIRCSLTTTPPSGWQFVLIDGRAELVRVKPDAGPR